MWTHLDEASHRLISAEIDRQEDRGAAIIAAAFLEDRLLFCLANHFKNRDRFLENQLFRGLGPLSSFSAKIDIAFLLGIFDQEGRDQIHIIRRVRNAFAHTMTPLQFTSSNISDMCSNLPNFKKALEILTTPTSDIKYLEIMKPFYESLANVEDSPRNRYMNSIKLYLLVLSLIGTAVSIKEPQDSRPSSI